MHEIHLDDYEEEVVRFLAKRFDGGGKWVGEGEFPRSEEVGPDKIGTVAGRFINHGWLESQSSDSWTILREVLDVAEGLDHPPPKDYWKGVITWFRGKWWSIPILVIAVVLPLAVQWMEMIVTLIKWIGLGS
jgi:hypothetical protein